MLVSILLHKFGVRIYEYALKEMKKRDSFILISEVGQHDTLQLAH